MTRLEAWKEEEKKRIEELELYGVISEIRRDEDLLSCDYCAYQFDKDMCGMWRRIEGDKSVGFGNCRCTEGMVEYLESEVEE